MLIIQGSKIPFIGKGGNNFQKSPTNINSMFDYVNNNFDKLVLVNCAYFLLCKWTANSKGEIYEGRSKNMVSSFDFFFICKNQRVFFYEHEKFETVLKDFEFYQKSHFLHITFSL